MRVLVVDDSAIVRDRLVEILSALEGVERVDTAARASEAREAIQSARPDVLVLDIHMPGGSGIEVLEALRADNGRILAIVLTNDPAPQWRAASLRAGADFFFDKSVEFQQAVDVIAHLALGRARAVSRCETADTTGESVEGMRLVFHDGEPVGSQGIAQAISERRRREQERLQAQKIEALGHLSDLVAHPLHNLLTVIIAHTGTLLHRLTPGDPARNAAVEVHDAAECGAVLTGQLVSLSRPETPMAARIDLNAVVGRLAPMLRRLIGGHIDLAVRTGANPAGVTADPGQLEQVIVNVLINAREAMSEGGALTVETSNAEFAEHKAGDHVQVRSGAYVVLVVRDTGHGMDARAKAHFFSTAQRIMEQSNGYIFDDSEPGRGTTVRLCFPLTLEAATEPAPPVSNRAKSILLVEDDPAVRRFTSRLLAIQGYQVIAASSPEEAQRLCDAQPGGADLLLTDINLPGMTGRALATALRSRHPGMKVIYMSGFPNEEDAIGGLFPAAEFLGKPFTSSELEARVRAVLETGN